ncbi:MAG: hypothetical protein MUF18_13805 [Fimbriiglobus sp.]|jgi:hypothetical protein|nr:hypothetical protein [Fimbriiglobus sp.]
MPKDSMLGLLAGVAAVVLIAVVYYQKNPTPAGAGTPATTPGKPAPQYSTPAVTPVVPR